MKPPKQRQPVLVDRVSLCETGTLRNTIESEIIDVAKLRENFWRDRRFLTTSLRSTGKERSGRA